MKHRVKTLLCLGWLCLQSFSCLVGWDPAGNLSDIGQVSYRPQVATNASGNAVAVWMRTDDSHYIVQAKRYDVETDS